MPSSSRTSALPAFDEADRLPCLTTVTPAPAFQRYLVQLTVTSLAAQAVGQSDDIQAVIFGFDVTVK